MLAAARQIAEVERDQARRIREGQTLRQQTAFDDYLAHRSEDPSYTFRQHLAAPAEPSKNRSPRVPGLRADSKNNPNDGDRAGPWRSLLLLLVEVWRRSVVD